MAFAPFKVSYANDLGIEVVDIYVGPEQKRYVVHKSLLTSQSEYYYKALTGSFMEAKENSIHLKEEDPDAVALFVAWLYRGVIPGTEKSMSPFVTTIFPFSETIQIPISEQGTIYPFAPTQVPTLGAGSLFGGSNFTSDRINHICSQSHYTVLSPEELRLTDYKLGQKYQGDGVLATAPAPAPAQGQNSLPVGLFGGLSAYSSNSSANQPTNNLFGSTPATSATYLSNFATGSPVSSGHPSGSSSVAIQAAPANQTHVNPLLSNLPAPKNPSNGPLGPGYTLSQSQNSSTISQAPTAPVAATSLLSTFVSPTGHNLFGGAAQATSHSSNPPTGVNNATGNVSTAQGHNPGASTSFTGPPAFGAVLPPPVTSHGASTSSGLFGGISFGNPAHHDTYKSIYGPHAILPAGIQIATIRHQRSKPKNPSEFGYYHSIKHSASPLVFIKGIPKRDPRDEEFIDLEQHQVALLNLCIMAEVQCWPTLFDDAVNAYIQGEHRLQRPLSLDFIDRIYSRTYPESSLRAYVMDSISRMKIEGVKDISPYMEVANKHDDFLADLLGKVMGSSPPLETLTEQNLEDYHMFGSAKDDPQI